jgi:hypothetical protein
VYLNDSVTGIVVSFLFFFKLLKTALEQPVTAGTEVRINFMFYVINPLFKDLFPVDPSFTAPCIVTIDHRISLFFFPGATQPIVGVYFTALYQALASSRTRLLDHTQRRATVGRTPLNE